MRFRESLAGTALHTVLLRRWKNVASLCIGTRRASKRYYPAAKGTRLRALCSRCWPRWRATNQKLCASASNRVSRWRANEMSFLVGEREQRSRDDQFLQTHKDILRQLKAGQSVRNVAKIVDKSVSTVQRVKAALAA